MIGLVIVIHVIICVLLIGIILVQAGRGGGLVDSFSGVESMFGTKTNSFLTRTTTTLSVLFFLTCLSLALLSVRQSRSLMRNLKTQEQPAKLPAAAQPPAATPSPAQSQAPKQETPVTQGDAKAE